MSLSGRHCKVTWQKDAELGKDKELEPMTPFITAYLHTLCFLDSKEALSPFRSDSLGLG